MASSSGSSGGKGQGGKGSGKASPAALGDEYYKDWMKEKKKKKQEINMFPNSPKSPTGR